MKIKYLFEPIPNRMYISKIDERFVVVDLVHDGFVYLHYCVGAKCNIVHLKEFKKEFCLLETNTEKQRKARFTKLSAVMFFAVAVYYLISAIGY